MLQSERESIYFWGSRGGGLPTITKMSSFKCGKFSERTCEKKGIMLPTSERSLVREGSGGGGGGGGGVPQMDGDVLWLALHWVKGK